MAQLQPGTHAIHPKQMGAHTTLACGNRKGMPETTINVDLARKAFEKLWHQRCIALYLVGGFQTGGTKKYWLEHHDGKCTLCGQHDERGHSLLKCAALKEVRDGHPRAVRALEENPAWQYLPPPIRPQEAEAMQLENTANLRPGRWHYC